MPARLDLLVGCLVNEADALVAVPGSDSDGSSFEQWRS